MSFVSKEIENKLKLNEGTIFQTKTIEYDLCSMNKGSIPQTKIIENVLCQNLQSCFEGWYKSPEEINSKIALKVSIATQLLNYLLKCRILF